MTDKLGKLFSVTGGVFEYARLALVFIAAALMTYPVAHCQGKRDGRAQMQLAIEQANTRYLTQKARADELAAEQRLIDTIAVNEQERNLRDAIADTPDTAPDAVRIRLGCERLRRAGTDPASLPACR